MFILAILLLSEQRFEWQRFECSRAITTVTYYFKKNLEKIVPPADRSRVYPSIKNNLKSFLKEVRKPNEPYLIWQKVLAAHTILRSLVLYPELPTLLKLLVSKQ